MLSAILSHKRLRAGNGLTSHLTCTKSAVQVHAALQRDAPVVEAVHEPAALGSVEAIDSSVMNVIITAPVALTGTCTGHLHSAAMGDTTSFRQLATHRSMSGSGIPCSAPAWPASAMLVSLLHIGPKNCQDLISETASRARANSPRRDLQPGQVPITVQKPVGSHSWVRTQDNVQQCSPESRKLRGQVCH